MDGRNRAGDALSDDVPASDPSPARGRRSGKGPFAFAVLLSSLWAIGQLARDRWLPTALLFYLPSVLVAALLLVLAASLALAGAGRRARAVLLLAILPGAMVLGVENRWLGARPHPADEPSVRVAGWNVAGFRFGPGRIGDALAACDADLILLSEAAGRGPRDLQARFAGAYHRYSSGALTFLVRGELTEVRSLEAGQELQLVLVRWSLGGEQISVLGANLISSPLVPRDPLLSRLVATVARERPDLVLGDFNAPRRSRALTALPPGYRHAYDLAGHGWSASWPVPVPLLPIDQAIVGPRLRALDYRLLSTPWSDHRQQILDLAWPPAARPEG